MKYDMLLKYCSDVIQPITLCSCSGKKDKCKKDACSNCVKVNSSDMINKEYNIVCDKSVIDYDRIKCKYSELNNINQPKSCDALYIHDDECISFIEFRTKAKSPDKSILRHKIDDSCEILLKVLNVDGDVEFKKNKIYYYVVFNKNVFDNEKFSTWFGSNEQLLYFGIAKLAESLVDYCGLNDQIIKYKDLKVIMDDQFLSMLEDDYWKSKCMEEL